MVKDLSEGLVLDLDMDTLEDYSGNGNDGTNYGSSLTVDRFGRFNQARSFDGSNDYIAIENLYYDSDYSALSVSAWFKTSTSTENIIMSYDRNEYWRLEIGGDNTSKRVAMSFYTDSGQVDNFESSTDVDDNNWHHVVFTYNAGNAYLYVDGSLEDSTTSGSKIGTGNTRYGFIGVGSEAESFDGDKGPDDYFDGEIDNVKIWNRALSSTEISQLYNSVKHNYQGLFDGLVAGYDFKKDAKDFSGNGYDGTVNGATLTTDRFGVSDGCYSFDGTNDKITVGDVSDLEFASGESFSFSFWYKTTETASSGVFTKGFFGSSQTTPWYLFRSGTYAEFYLRDSSSNSYNNSNAQGTSTPIDDDVWHHIVMVYNADDSASYIYIDGNLDSTLTGIPNDSYGTNSGDFGFGTHENKYWEGSLSIFLVYNKALTADEIQTLYDLTSKGKIYPYQESRKGGITE